MSYLNTRPLVFGHRARDCGGVGSICPTPSRPARRPDASDGELDIALLPVIELARMPDLELVPGLWGSSPRTEPIGSPGLAGPASIRSSRSRSIPSHGPATRSSECSSTECGTDRPRDSTTRPGGLDDSLIRLTTRRCGSATRRCSSRSPRTARSSTTSVRVPGRRRRDCRSCSPPGPRAPARSTRRSTEALHDSKRRGLAGDRRDRRRLHLARLGSIRACRRLPRPTSHPLPSRLGRDPRRCEAVL